MKKVITPGMYLLYSISSLHSRVKDIFRIELVKYNHSESIFCGQ